MTAVHPILEACDMIEEVSILADELADACDTIDVALMVLGRLEDARKHIAAVADVIDARAIVLRPRGQTLAPIPVPGGGVYKVSGGQTKDVYDNDSLRMAIESAAIRRVDASAIITTTGETCAPEPILTDLVRDLLTLAGASGENFSSWRKGGADALGINLASYRDRHTTGLRGRIESRSPMQG
jgi:hypothetical protein